MMKINFRGAFASSLQDEIDNSARLMSFSSAKVSPDEEAEPKNTSTPPTPQPSGNDEIVTISPFNPLFYQWAYVQIADFDDDDADDDEINQKLSTLSLK